MATKIITREADDTESDVTEPVEPPLLAAGDMSTIADLLELNQRMTLASGVIVGHGQIDAEKASLLLDVNTSNRTTSEELVSSFVRMMRNGDWLLNGATISVGKDNSLQDGQHRMEAVKESGVALPFTVFLGLPPEAQDVTDTGRKRSAADQLAIHAVPNAANAAAALRLLMAWESGNVLHSSYTIGNIEAVNKARAWGEEFNDSVRVGLSARLNGVAIPTAPLAALHYRLMTMDNVDRKAIDAFYTKVCQGVGIQKGDPEFALRRLFMRRAQVGIRTGRSEALYYIVRTWNARVKGQEIAKLQLPRNGLKVETFPQPIANAGDVDLVDEMPGSDAAESQASVSA